MPRSGQCRLLGGVPSHGYGVAWLGLAANELQAPLLLAARCQMLTHCPRPKSCESLRASLSLLRATVPSEGSPLPSQARTSFVAHRSLPQLTHDKLFF